MVVATPPNCESAAGRDHLEILARHGQRIGSTLLSHKLEDLALATGQVAGAETTHRSLPQALDDWLAERC
jgi:hypothetical protein